MCMCDKRWCTQSLLLSKDATRAHISASGMLFEKRCYSMAKAQILTIDPMNSLF